MMATRKRSDERTQKEGSNESSRGSMRHDFLFVTLELLPFSMIAMMELYCISLSFLDP